MSSPSTTLADLLELAYLTSGADSGELVIGGEANTALFAPRSPHRRVLGDQWTLSEVEFVADASGDDRCADWVRSYVVAPITSPDGDAGWLAVGSVAPNAIDANSKDVLTRIAGLVEDHLDRTLEQKRLDELSALLVSNERHLQVVRTRLEESNEELEQFAYIAAHELVAPLRTVAVYCELLDRVVEDPDADSDAKVLEFADEIRSGVAQMSERVEHLMELSRTHSEPSDTEPTDLAMVVGDAIRTLAGPIRDLDARIEVGALPVVSGHPIRLQSVFANLISNALRYREPTRRPEITIESIVEPNGVMVRVIDNGIGLDTEDTSRLFQLFERSANATSVPGSGIGLSLSRRIAESVGAEMGAESAEPVGSVFWIRFPAVTQPR